MAIATKRWVRDQIGEGPEHPRRIDLSNAGGFRLNSKVCFGYKLNPDGDDPDAVKIYSGEIDRIAVAETASPYITVQDNWYIYVRRTIVGDTMLIATAASVPANDATYSYYPLYQFTVTAGVASIKKILRPFNIDGGNDTITVVTAVQYDTVTCQLQIKTQSVRCTKVGTESAWTMITGGQAAECDA
ncbi:MAG: hypothetical protein L6455_14645 [Kiritimatiellae bacterium]|nr:hypothetical protein [Kiritimatiellia bacterium]